jgi:hypothetical protein
MIEENVAEKQWFFNVFLRSFPRSKDPVEGEK